MEQISVQTNTERYAKCIEVSKRVRWDIDTDVIRDREFDFSKKLLPDGISKVHELDFLNEEEERFLSQVQGRTYANMFGFVERFITAKILEITKDHWFGDQVALESLIRFCDEEVKHQALFRKVEAMLANGMPEGYSFPYDPNEVAQNVLLNSTWAVLALILEIELFTQEHYKQSIEPGEDICPLYKDLFLFHWKEETTHAMMDELEWPREDAKLSPEERDRAVDELIGMVGSIDKILQEQSRADVAYFLQTTPRGFNEENAQRVRNAVLKAYRWQYIFSGVEHKRFQALLHALTTQEQRQRMEQGLAQLV